MDSHDLFKRLSTNLAFPTRKSHVNEEVNSSLRPPLDLSFSCFIILENNFN